MVSLSLLNYDHLDQGVGWVGGFGGWVGLVGGGLGKIWEFFLQGLGGKFGSCFVLCILRSAVWWRPFS